MIIKLALTLAITISLSACGTLQDAPIPLHMEKLGARTMTSKSQIKLITLRVEFLSATEVNARCKKAEMVANLIKTGQAIVPNPDATRGACATTTRVRRENDLCTVYAREPESFFDAPGLIMLGHEIWHCLGADHESQ